MSTMTFWFIVAAMVAAVSVCGFLYAAQIRTDEDEAEIPEEQHDGSGRLACKPSSPVILVENNVELNFGGCIPEVEIESSQQADADPRVMMIAEEITRSLETEDHQLAEEADLAVGTSGLVKEADLAVGTSGLVKEADLAVGTSGLVKEADLAVGTSGLVKEADLAVETPRLVEEAAFAVETSEMKAKKPSKRVSVKKKR